MKVKYFEGTDTIYTEFRADTIAETHDLDENTLLDLGGARRTCAMTLEHASQRTDSKHFSFEQIAA